MSNTRIGLLLILVVALASPGKAMGQQTAFTYSGVLYATNLSLTGTGPAIGTFDFRCSLWPSLTENAPANRIGQTNEFTVQLSAGAFATNLDFGALTGGPYFVQTEVRRAGTVAFKMLSPRKEILPTPLAQHAQTASNLLGTVSSASLTGTISDARLSPNVALLNASPSFSGTLTANGFIGAGGGLTGLDGAAMQSGSIANAGVANGTLTASKIASGQVVKSVNGLSDAVTLSAGPNVTFTPSGNNIQISANSGAGGLPWQVISGTAQQAFPNTGYLLTNDAQVILNLPTSPNVGDVVRVSGSGAGGWKITQNPGQTVLIKNSQSNWTPRDINRNWQCLASSADGTKLVAGVNGGQIYTSADSGVTWTARDSSRPWQCVASSADGSKLIAGSYPGQLYTSTDSGVTWLPQETSRSWFSVASSADGSKLVAADSSLDGGQIYTSTDSGVTWTPRENVRAWLAVASSADGTKLVAGVDGGQIYTSTDSGLTWTSRASAHFWTSIASSADGTKLVAVDEGLSSSQPGRIYVSTDSGVNWQTRVGARRWISVASSADGTKLVAASYESGGGEIFTSSNSGATWTPREGYRGWNCVTSSADGNKLVAGVYGGQLYLRLA